MTDSARVPLDFAELDSRYVPFPSFTEWLNVGIDLAAWGAAVGIVQERALNSPNRYRYALDVARRAAAVDTGAIEGLYDVDAGFTITVAAQIGLWQAAFETKAEHARAMIEAQIAAYDEILDLATGETPFAEAWIRGLHALICRAQGTYVVLTATGTQEQDLPLGVYKQFPNHVVQPDGSLHAYAPVLQTQNEVRRMVEELTSASFLSAHPVVQAAYSHFALVSIHPFADGNGRVARALASVFLYRGCSIPLMVLMENKSEYLAVIRRADEGRFQPLIDFVVARSLDAFRLISESMRTASLPQPADLASELTRLRTTRGGYTHAEIDYAGANLLLSVQQRAVDLAARYSVQGQLGITVRRRNASWPSSPENYRGPVAVPADLLEIIFQSTPPVSGEVVLNLVFFVPKDALATDEIIILCLNNNGELRVQVAGRIPVATTVAALQVAMYVEGLFGVALAELASQGAKALRDQGYSS
jgi:Fic family protein